MSHQRGFTLVELLVALVLGLIAIGFGFDAMTKTARSSRARIERVGVGTNLRTAAGLLERELGRLGADSISGPDLLDFTANSIGYRSLHGFAISCRVAADTLEVALDGNAGFERQPIPGRDSVLVYAAGDSTSRTDAWFAIPLVAVGSATCPSGGPAARWITRLDQSTMDRRGIRGPTVVRVFDIREIRAYTSAGVLTLGVEDRSAAAPVQPVVSPLTGPGLEVAGFDWRGLGATDPRLVVVLALGLQAATARELGVGFGRMAGAARDSFHVVLHLRNAR